MTVGAVFAGPELSSVLPNMAPESRPLPEGNARGDSFFARSFGDCVEDDTPEAPALAPAMVFLETAVNMSGSDEV